MQRDLEMAELSACAYHRRPCQSNWIDVPPGALGLVDQDLDDGDFDARIFQNPVTSEYVVVFRGTDDLRDVLDDLGQFNGESSNQYRAAASLGRRLNTLRPNHNISFSGHSLGGGLATTAALASGRRATVFNAAALHADTAQQLQLNISRAATLVENLTVDGEIVTTAQDTPHLPPGANPFPSHDAHLYPRDLVSNPAPGARFLLPQPAYAWMEQQQDALPFFFRPEMIRRHLMATVIESLTTLLEVACGIPR